MPNAWNKITIPFPKHSPLSPIWHHPQKNPNQTTTNNNNKKAQPNKINKWIDQREHKLWSVWNKTRWLHVHEVKWKENSLMSVVQRTCFCQIFRSICPNCKVFSMSLILLYPTTYLKLWLVHQLSLLKKEDNNFLYADTWTNTFDLEISFIWSVLIFPLLPGWREWNACYRGFR